MRLRIRSPELNNTQRAALARRARLVLGRHAAEIDRVELTIEPESGHNFENSECRLVVKLRDGGEVRVHDDGNHPHRALLRAAWRIEIRVELARLREARGGPAELSTARFLNPRRTP